MYYYTNTALYHHGILGMHWGIRRYQNRDGSLTAEGIKRYRTDLKFKAKYDKYAAKQDAKNQKKAAKREAERINKIKTKSVKDLTDDELRERILRLELEKRMIDLERAVNNSTQSGGQNKQQSDSDRRTNAVMQWGKAAAGSLIKTTTGLATTYLANKMMERVFPDYKKEKSKQEKKNKNDNNDNNDDYDEVVETVKTTINGSGSKKKKNKNKNNNGNERAMQRTNDDLERANQIMSYDDYASSLNSKTGKLTTKHDYNPFASGTNAKNYYNGGKYDFLADIGSSSGVNYDATRKGKEYANAYFNGEKRAYSATDMSIDDILRDYNKR